MADPTRDRLDQAHRNGVKELVTIDVKTWVSRTDVTVHAFTRGGGELTGYPRTHVLPPVGFDAGQMFPSKHGVPSATDLDRDGAPEIAWSYSDRVFLFDHRGEILPGWPFVAPLYNGKVMLFENAVASGDIDGDGRLELFSAARVQNCGGCEAQLYAWSKDGTVLSGWPVDDQRDGIKLWNTATSQNTPVLVDLDGYGRIELAVAYADIDNQLDLFLWTIPGSGIDLEWPMFNRDSARSGRLSDDRIPPPAPVLLNPAADATTSDATPDFRWQAVQDLSGVRYRLQVDDTPGFASPAVDVAGLTVTAHTPTRAVSSGAHVWRVSAIDGAGNLGPWRARSVTSMSPRQSRSRRPACSRRLPPAPR